MKYLRENKIIIIIIISFWLELIPPRGGVNHLDPSSPLLTVSSIFFLQSETFHVLLYDVCPSLLLSSSTAASVNLCRHSSVGVFVLSSHHMTLPHTISIWGLTFCQ